MLLFGMYYCNQIFSKYLNVQSGKVEKWKSSSSVQTFSETCCVVTTNLLKISLIT